jgi:hypothetical protein
MFRTVEREGPCAGRRKCAGAVELEIFADNIVEAERAMLLVVAALRPGGAPPRWIDSPLYAPAFACEDVTGKPPLRLRLFPGHGRWATDLRGHLTAAGDAIGENVDAVVCRVLDDRATFEPLLALEFCSSLPAGNNAWQRTARALGAAAAKIPFLSFVEIGGEEMSELRERRGSRFPNPLVPAAYALADTRAGEAVAYVVGAADSSVAAEVAHYADVLGRSDALAVVRAALAGGRDGTARKALRRKAFATAVMLSAARKREGTMFSQAEWEDAFAALLAGRGAQYVLGRKQPWRKKIALKTSTSYVAALVEAAIACGAVGVGTSDLPLCLLPPSARAEFARRAGEILAHPPDEALAWLRDGTKPLLLCWILGYKPTYDDARPDRGLPTLGRMVFDDEVDSMAIVYGPIPPRHRALLSDHQRIAVANGLWRSMTYACDAILPVGRTLDAAERRIVLVTRSAALPVTAADPVLRSEDRSPTLFAEDDVDTVLHLLLAARSPFTRTTIVEGMCNPPGGDWSGVTAVGADGVVYRYTSLDRVSGTGKRPDHLATFVEAARRTVLVVESKESVKALRREPGVGPKLAAWTRKLFEFAPNLRRRDATTYEPNAAGVSCGPDAVVTGVAAIGQVDADVARELGADLGIGIAFDRDAETVRCSVAVVSERGERIAEVLGEQARAFGDRIVVDVHRFVDVVQPQLHDAPER